MSYMRNTNITKTQKQALGKINKIYKHMLECNYTDDLFDLYCEAEDIWAENFPFEFNIEGDDWWLTKKYVDLDRKLRKNIEENPTVTINLFGCNVTVNR